MTVRTQHVVLALGVLCLLSAVLLLGFRQAIPFLDEGIWLERVALHQENLRGITPLAPGDLTHSNSPGLTVLTGAAALTHWGVSPVPALRAATVAWVVAGAGVAALAAYVLRPRSWWWLAVFAILIFHHTSLETTPISAVASTLIPSFVILVLLLWKHPHRVGFVVLGASVMCSLLTRWPATFIVATPLLLALLIHHRARHIDAMVIGAGLALLACGSLYLSHPIDMLVISPGQSFLNLDATVASSHLHIDTLLRFGLVTVISMLLAVLTLTRSSSWSYRLFPGVLVLTSSLYAIAFSSIAAPAVRHWIPLIITWEILLPWWVFQLSSNPRIQHASVALVGGGAMVLTIIGL